MVATIPNTRTDKKRLLFLINTAGQAYTWRYCMGNLQKQGHEVFILARDHGPTLKILSSFGFNFTSFKPHKSKNLKLLDLSSHLSNGIRQALKNKVSVLIGFGIDTCLTGLLLNKPSIIFTDSELIPVQNFIIQHTASIIVTPNCFLTDLGKKHIRVMGYKELAYLHPDNFQPDPSVFDELGLKLDEKFVLLRFGAFEAMHDIGLNGFSNEDKYRLVKMMEKYARVFVSVEGKSLPELEKYKLPTHPNRIHHVLYYAQMLVGDGGTSTTEAAILGTPAIRYVSLAGPNDLGNFRELENRYGLIFSFNDPQSALYKANEIIQQPDLKDTWLKKREKMLQEKVNVANFMTMLIENYPVDLKHMSNLESIKA